MVMKDLKSNLKFFGITHREVARELGIAQSTVTQVLDEELVSRIKDTAQELIDRKVSLSQEYQNGRIADMKRKINPVIH